jgi:cytochrome bd-type quinol oxidase subunit 1
VNGPALARLVGGWFAAFAVSFAVAVVWGAVITVGIAQLWLMACVVPPVVMLLVRRGSRARSA